MCFASKPLQYMDSERTGNPMLLFPGAVKGSVNCLFKLIKKWEKIYLQNTLSVARTSKALSFLFTYLCISM